MIFSVADILHELSQRFELRAGDLVFMGTPAGVGALQARRPLAGRTGRAGGVFGPDRRMTFGRAVLSL